MMNMKGKYSNYKELCGMIKKAVLSLLAVKNKTVDELIKDTSWEMTPASRDSSPFDACIPVSGSWTQT